MRQRLLKVLLLACVLAPATSAFATTWNEPWHGQVVREADSLGLFEVLEVDGERARVRTIRTLAGMPTPAEFEIGGPHALPLTSRSGQGHDEHALAMRVGQQVYLLPSKIDGQWRLPTPTAGIDPVQPDGNVAATYRISFNQARQPAEAYERVQACLFRAMHAGQCNVAALASDLDEPLKSAPATLADGSPEQHALFFRQHVALESAYLLDRSLPLETIEPFLRAPFFHQQISAVRALAASEDPGRDARIVAFVKDESRTPVARAMALFLAWSANDRAVLDALQDYSPSDPDETSYLPLNVMDPRVGTAFPGTIGAALKGPRSE